MKALSDRLLRFLTPSPFWIVVFLLGIGALAGWGGYEYARVARDEAVRAADGRARVVDCLSSRGLIHKFDLHVEGVNEFARTQVVNARAQLAVTPHSSRMYRVRRANLNRLIRAQRNVAALKAIPVPTKAQCRNLADPHG